MIIYLYGPDSYRRIKKQKEIIREYITRHSGLTVERFYLNENPDCWDGLKNFTNSRSLFGGKKLAVVSGLSAAALAKADLSFLKLLTKDESLVVLVSEDKKLGREFDFLGKKPSLSQDFENLTLKQFGNFLAKEAKEKNIALNNQPLSALARNFCPDSWGAVMEMEKLALLRHSSLPVIASEAKQSSGNLGVPIFNLIYKLKSRDLRERVGALELLLKTEDSAKVFNLAAYSIGQKIKFADYDSMIKSGKLDYETALTEAII